MSGTRLQRIPWWLVGTTLALLGLGWVAMARCEELSAVRVHYLRQHVIWSLLALGVMFAAAWPSYRVVCRWSYAAFALSLVLLVVVYWCTPINGARRWIRFGPLGMQPSELAKVAFVLALARYLMYRENYRRLSGMLWPLGLTLVPVLLILREPDLGTALVFLPVLFAMLFAAGARRSDLVKLALAGVLVLPLLWAGMSREQRSRVTALFEQPGPGEAVTADTYQLHQAKQVMMLGGLCGSLWTGPAVEDPAAYRLPEARCDFILAIVGERLGLLGIALVLGLYCALVFQGYSIALATQDPFGRLAATGLTSLLAVQVLINAGMAVGLLPVTGLSLPLLSYGGSGLVTFGLVLGLLMNVGMRPGYDVAGEPFRYTLTPQLE